MRTYVQPPVGAEPLSIRPERLRALGEYVRQKIDDALHARRGLEQVWRKALADYKARRDPDPVDVPVEGTPQITVPVGAIGTTAIYSRIIDGMFSVKPPVLCEAESREMDETARGLQKLANWSARNELFLKPASKQFVFDMCQLGTGVYYVPWTRGVRKGAGSIVVAEECPRVISTPPEDFLVPRGAPYVLDQAPWCARRTWLSDDDIALRVKTLGWRVRGGVLKRSTAEQDMELQRLRVSHQGETLQREGVYEIWQAYIGWDVDGDGIAEDLLVTVDRTTAHVLDVRWSPYLRRPFQLGRYQIQSHVTWGEGVMEATEPMQYEASFVHRYRMLNSILSQSRVWVAKRGAIKTGSVRPGDVIEVDGDPRTLVMGLPMADVFPSSYSDESNVLLLAEKRTGISDLATNPGGAIRGNRTPATTAVAIFNSQNVRHSEPFDEAFEATGSAVRQALWRYSEQVRAGNDDVRALIARVVGPQAPQVLELLSMPDFDENVAVTMKAATPTSNKELDRALLMDQMTVANQYGQTVLGLANVAATHPADAMRSLALDLSEKAAIMLRRFFDTFEGIRDANDLTVDAAEHFAVAADRMRAQSALAAQGAPQGEGDIPLSPGDVLG